MGMGYWSIGIVTSLVMGILLVGNFGNSSAIHNSEEVIWQLVMVSSYPACSNYHYQMMYKYEDVTQKYLELYQFENSNHKPVCMTEWEYGTEYEEPDDLDLLIVVYDRNKGRGELHPYDVGGFYSHLGDEWTHNHTIIFCDCSNFHYSNPVWILSHELSHFVLNYLDFDLVVAEEKIHALDKKFDYCAEVGYDASCSEVKTRISGLNGNYVMMKPYAPAIGKKVITSSTDGTFFDTPFKQEMFSEINSWWLAGEVSDEKYAKSMEVLAGKADMRDRKGGFFSKESSHLILTEPSKDTKFDFSDRTKVAEWIQQKADEVLYMVPGVQEYQWSLFEEKKEIEFPQWYKTRALWWQNGNITDAEFVSGMKYLLDPEAKLKVQPKVEPKVEPKIEQKAEPKAELESEPKVEQNVEQNVEQKVEPESEPKVEPKSEPTCGEVVLKNAKGTEVIVNIPC